MFLNFISYFFYKPTKEEIAELIERFINGEDVLKFYEWDDFVSVRLRDPLLEKIRRRCSEIEKEFPVPGKEGLFVNEEGMKVLRAYVKELREKK